MVRLTALLLLSGLIALMVGIKIFYTSPERIGQQQPVTWDAATVLVESGTGIRIDQDLRLQLGASGLGVIVLPVSTVSTVPAEAFPFLHLGFSHALQDMLVFVMWTSAQTGSKTHVHAITENYESSLWIDMRGKPGWSGDITSLAVAAEGQPGAAVTITDISMIPVSLSAQLRVIYSDWTDFVPWQHHSVNTYTGRGLARSPYYPVAVTIIFLSLSIIAYGLVLLISRGRMSFDWHVVVAVFLACWIGLDLIWQGKLLRQLELTYQKFYGKDSQDKLEASIDASLVQFMAEVKQRLDGPDSRIFVSSSDDYLGMRGAYYLYPFNVFWQRHGKELPRGKYIHRGDYIVVVQPAQTQFNAVTGMLLSPQSKPISAESILTRGLGSLYRVK